MKKLSRSEFADALQKGKGSAYLYVKKYGDADIKSDLLNATLHAIGYDTQLEGSRSKWMMDILSLTNNPEYYYQAIFDGYLDSTELWDVSQQSEILAILAQNNYPGARELLYQKFDLQQFEENWLIAQEIIELDGMQGMLYAANIIGQKIRISPDIYESLMDTACGLLDKEIIIQELKKAAKTNDNIAAYLEHIQKNEMDHSSHPSSDTLSLPDFLSFIEASPHKVTRFQCRKLARKSTPEKIQEIFEKMLLETREEQLLRYGWFFEVAQMPSVSQQLFKLVESDNEKLRFSFTRALSLVTDESVRLFALNLLDEENLAGLRLLVNNFSPMDWKIITEKISDRPSDQEIVHDCCLDLIQILSKNPENPPVHILLWIYENSPCVECRNSAVEDLLEINMLPLSLTEECKYDCYEVIRSKFT